MFIVDKLLKNRQYLLRKFENKILIKERDFNFYELPGKIFAPDGVDISIIGF